LQSLVTLTDQHHRDRERLETVNDQLFAIESGAPDRIAILRAIKDLESLWEHLTIVERSRLITLIIERNPVDGNLSITLGAAAGLQSFGTSQSDAHPSNPDRRS
jgi:hypothetical protein